MKKQLLYKLGLILLLSPIHLFSQATLPANMDITGLWKGELYNDTTQKYLPYEIAISEEKGKLSGYSYTVFDIDGKKEVGVKRVKIKRKDDKIIIEDEELIANDYSAPPPRGVRQMSVVSISVNDTAMLLTGAWKTNRTREYRPLTGSIKLQRKPDFRPLALFKKLEELKLQNDLSFLQTEQTAIVPSKDIAVGSIKTDEPIKTVINPPVESATKTIEDNIEETERLSLSKKIETPLLTTAPIKAENKHGARININPVESNKVKEMAVSLPVKKAEIIVVAIEPRTAENNPVTEIKDKPVVINAPKNNSSPVVKNPATTVVVNDPVKTKPQPIPVTLAKANDIEKPVAQKKPNPIVSNNPPAVIEKPAPVAINKPKPIISPPAEKKPDPVVINLPAKNDKLPVPPMPDPEKKQETAVFTPVVQAAANVTERKINNIQSVFYKSDSLILTLYDNGEVDGDTVSVLMNGNVIISRQGLDIKPNFKTIHISAETPDSIMLVMYAENLGSIPPNTGLLVVHDGDAVYEVRFSADLKTNAAILLRRQKKEK